MKKRKETTITRFFETNTNHRHQQVYESRTEEQNNINNIGYPKQGIMQKKITDTEYKQNKLISPTTTLKTTKNNLQYIAINATKNKYCAPINSYHLHSVTHKNRQLIYFFSCGHKKIITLNNISSHSKNTRAQSSHGQRYKTTYFHCNKCHQINSQQEVAKAKKNNDRVNLNNIYCYPANNNNTEKSILTTRTIIYTYSCGHNKSLTP